MFEFDVELEHGNLQGRLLLRGSRLRDRHRDVGARRAAGKGAGKVPRRGGGSGGRTGSGSGIQGSGKEKGRTTPTNPSTIARLHRGRSRLVPLRARDAAAGIDAGTGAKGQGWTMFALRRRGIVNILRKNVGEGGFTDFQLLSPQLDSGESPDGRGRWATAAVGGRRVVGTRRHEQG